MGSFFFFLQTQSIIELIQMNKIPRMVIWPNLKQIYATFISTYSMF
jgi:hypothetical protein